MNLDTALGMVTGLRTVLALGLPVQPNPEALEALGLVLEAAGSRAVASVTAAKAPDAEVLCTFAGEVVTPHLFVGPSGGTCYLCPHPRDHGIHQNRGTP